MIPSIIARQVESGIKNFLETTFPPSNQFFHGILDRLFAERDHLFKGPYVSMKLPFLPGSNGKNHFKSFKMQFEPFLHQEKAFQRLAILDPLSTIVSTGTGSGKTEAFLFPIIDYCFQHRAEPGIKAIIIYPMNALANDQAKRIARLINSEPNLNGNVTAGLFVGQDPRGQGQMTMGPEMVITHKDTMRTSPPDILLTNYKMLDYLLIRPMDFPLWKNNKPETLKYLVVDELHTFDGAQGSDLACLIRRLKARVKAPENQVCCVGTSATLGDGEGVDDLREYASQIFGESFDENSVITEERKTPNQFLGEISTAIGAVPIDQSLQVLSPDNYDTWPAFILAQYELWFPGNSVDIENESMPVQLGNQLRQHEFFRDLVRVIDNNTLSLQGIKTQLKNTVSGLREYPDDLLIRLIESILALVSVARNPRAASKGKYPPFLDVRVQLWMRELRRVVSSVEVSPKIRFSDDLKQEQLTSHLPLVHCRECGAMGWSALKKQHSNEFENDLQTFYQAYFNYSPRIHFIFPETESKDAQQKIKNYICGHCLHIGDGEVPEACHLCGSDDNLLTVNIHNTRIKRTNQVFGTHNCPYCESTDALTVVGSRSASLMSVVIGQLSSSIYNNDPDRKLITFSDSVQDASHRAGFFEARTYAFNFRTALQKVIQDMKGADALDKVATSFSKYWLNQLSKPAYVANFLAPNMAWLDDYESLRETGKIPPGSSLLQEVERRINWEIYSEYGFRARIGRTMERTGLSIAALPTKQLKKTASRLRQVLTNEFGGWENLSESAVKVFLLGFIAQLRTRGGVENPELHAYIHSWGNSYLLNKVNYMPGFGPHSRTPVFLTTKRGTRFDILLGADKNESWYQNWLYRSLGSFHVKISDYSKEIYENILKILVESKILISYDDMSHPVWGINPSALVIRQEVDQYRCDHCGFSASAAEAERTYWQGMPCRRFRCTGHYHLQAPKEDYYGKLYSSGALHRIFAGEHTGLLDRDTRTDLENRFIQREKATDENLLSCTPTMEMGINIGDLSTVLLCSIPPSQANYLQRIGRSGRQDGNAFNFAMAEGKPHDLYFFEEPVEMLAGSVDTPGIFLNAPAVLERQLVGYCFDCWIETGISPGILPKKINQVLANIKKGEKSGLFPFNWIKFIEINRSTLLSDFLALFKNDMNQLSKDRLKTFIEGDKADMDGLLYKVLDRLNGLEKERKNLKDRVRKISNTIKQKKQSKTRDQNTAKEVDALERDKSALNGIIRRINSKDIFNFFTDEGLLPNYAFPEAGILLRSVIYKKRKMGDKGGKYSTENYEYQRPAVTAIHELAPANTFFADGRKVVIDTVNLELSEPVDWRFCNACDYATLEVTNTQSAACPKCGSTIWGDHAQKRGMLKLHQVEATTSDRDSRVDDASDSREPQLYNKHMLAEVKSQFIEKAYKIDSEEFPFGFEFIRKVEFSEINFGLRGHENGVIEIAGKKVSDKGFTLCKDCGKVQSNGNEIKHSISCKYYNKPDETPLLNYLYLYREFTSEAIRMLLPLVSLEDQVKLHSFVAALYLGLKKVYKGSVDHIEATVIEEPVPGDSIKKQYLILYDRVPGGTGYLKELTASPENMMVLFESALQTLKNCSCHTDPDKDGCYRCIYAYRVSRDILNISRTEAIDLLSEIISQRENIVEIKTVGSISINTLSESKLEARFINALKSCTVGGKSAQLSKEVVHGKPGWRIKLEDRAYLIEPQVTLDQDQGVAITSRADFVFYPEKHSEVLPIAIFTDGFQFHADNSAGNMRIGKDLAQRMALVKSGNFLIWSLTWNDVESQFKQKSTDYFANYLNHNISSLGKLLDAYDEKDSTKLCSGYENDTAFDAFVKFLARPDAARWELYSFIQAINGPTGNFGLTDENWAIKQFERIIEPSSWDEFEIPTLSEQPTGETYNSILLKLDEVDRPLMCMHVSIPKDALRDPKRRTELKLTARLFDDPDIAETKGFKASWNGFLRLYNMMQFFPQVQFVTTQGLMAGDFNDVPQDAQISINAPINQTELLDLLELTDPDVHEILKDISSGNYILPEPGLEIIGENGQIIATVELGWLNEKIAILLPSEYPSIKILTASGWTVSKISNYLEKSENSLAHIPKLGKGKV